MVFCYYYLYFSFLYYSCCFLRYAMNLDPACKMSGNRMEKFSLRKAFEDPEDPYLPKEVQSLMLSLFQFLLLLFPSPRCYGDRRSSSVTE